MPEYTVLAALSVVVVVALEVAVLRTGVFRRAQFWISMAIVFFFQCLVDGWLTKLDAPIVLYGEAQMLGLRAPFDIPVEDFAFGFSMVTASILLWQWRLERIRERDSTSLGRTHALDRQERP